MATRIAEILQFNKFLNKKFIFVSFNKIRMPVKIQLNLSTKEFYFKIAFLI